MKYIICFLLFFTSVNVNARQQQTVDEFIKQQMSEQQITSLSIGIIKQGKIVKAQGYGMANLELNIPATKNTVYKVGSLSKQMIAAGIMLLIQTGKLNLSDTITKFFKDAPSPWHKITIRNLLNHTSGLLRESPGFNPLLVKPDSLIIRAAYNIPLVFETGTKWQYCNLSYFMLADIIRQVSGKPFVQFMQEAIFAKNNMPATRAVSASALVPHRADGYTRQGKDSILNATDFIAFRASGAFSSSITDMLQWELLMQQGKLLPSKTWQQMWTDVVTTDATKPTSEKYGYGWFVSSYLNKPLVYHGGSTPGFRSIYYRFPADNTAIIILTNTDFTNTTTLAKGIADRLNLE